MNPPSGREVVRKIYEVERELNRKMEFGARPTTASAPTRNAVKDQAVRDSSHSKRSDSRDKFQCGQAWFWCEPQRPFEVLTEALMLPVPRGACGYSATPQPRHHAPSGGLRCLRKNFFPISSEAFAHLATQVRSDWHRIWCAIPPSGRSSPEDLRGRERLNCKMEFRARPTTASAAQPSSGEIAPAAVDG